MALVKISPDLVLVLVAIGLILASRRLHRPNPAATREHGGSRALRGAYCAATATVLAALAAIICSFWAFSLPGPKTAFGGMLALDGYALFFKVLFAATLALAALLSVRQLATERVAPAEFYALLLLAGAGMMLAASAVELLTLYLGLELMTLCSVLLVGITRERPASNEAAIKYFLLASFASAVLLYGVGLAYGVTGSTDFSAIASAVSGRGLGRHPLLLAAVALVIAGLAFKIAAVPFHSWAPDAYQGACAPVAAFLAAGSKAAGLAALGRVCLIAFAPAFSLWSMLLLGLAALSITVGSLLALPQSDMKRLLAYSSIAHAGYALLGLLGGTPEGISATMTYAFVYAFMTLGAFGVVIGLGERGENLAGYRGLAAVRPGIAALMLLFMLSLTGIPPTAGFAAKFGVILSAVAAGHVALAVLAVACSVVSAFFYLRVAVFMYMTEPEGSAPPPCPKAVSVALAGAALITVIAGVFPGCLVSWAVPP